MRDLLASAGWEEALQKQAIAQRCLAALGDPRLVRGPGADEAAPLVLFEIGAWLSGLLSLTSSF